MLNLYLILALLPLLSLTTASHQNHPPHLRHRRIATVQAGAETQHQARAIAQVAPRSDTAHAKAKRAITGAVQKRGPKQQCRARNATSPQVPVSSSSPDSSSAVASPSSAPVPSSAASEAPPAPSDSWSPPAPEPSHPPASSEAPPAPAPAPSTPAPNHGGNSGLLNMNDGACGWCGSSDDAPNGSEDWLNCGLNGGGWNPPHLTLDKLIYKPLTADGVFAPCQNYFWAFEQFGAQYGVPPILLASFAMQESTCNPGATGGNGEAGLMQIAQPNCWGAPNGNCWDLAFNVERGAKIFSDLVNANGGNVLIAAGGYNGWRKGMTANDGMAAKWQGNCHAQNNLDYLHQLFNGWIQGRSGYNLGTYFNLKDC